MLAFRALASGSSGNAYLLRTDRVRLLFDAGLRFPLLRRYLADEGLDPADLGAVFISHEHRDHCASVLDLARCGVPVWSNAEVLRATGVAGHERACMLTVGQPVAFSDVEVVTFPVSHDAVMPMGFLIAVQDRTIALATDLGEENADLAAAVQLADLAVLEANHDMEMLHQGRYPYHLRRRVSSKTGHLSNVQAANILAGSLKSDDVTVWLAHLSKENNTPALATGTVGRTLKTAGFSRAPVAVARRDRPSLTWFGEARPRQLSLFDSLQAG